MYGSIGHQGSGLIVHSVVIVTGLPCLRREGCAHTVWLRWLATRP
jgi:hypothetical protein